MSAQGEIFRFENGRMGVFGMEECMVLGVSCMGHHEEFPLGCTITSDTQTPTGSGRYGFCSIIARQQKIRFSKP
jgi:hypothetical protein